MALGKNNRVHVVWNGGKGAAKATISGKEVTPLLYTRSTDSGAGFEPERNIITAAAGLDGGSSVAADPLGNVYVAWHAQTPGKTNGEASRALFIARSDNEGKTFKPERPAISAATGACGCCGMRAFADKSGAVSILYRAASEKVNRGEVFLVSPGPEADFKIANIHKWNIDKCPLSSASITAGNDKMIAAWETAGQVYFANINPKTAEVSKPIAPLGGVARKHPAVAANHKGETLLVWTEGTGWAKGGTIAWQLYDPSGKPAADKGRSPGLPVWGLATALAKADGNFVIIY